MRLEIAGTRIGARRLAWLSDEEPALFRHRLDVELGLEGPPLGFLLHNPATASHLVDDKSLVRMVGFGRRERACRVSVLNPAGYRTAKPRELRARFAAGLDIVGAENLAVVRRALLDLADEGGRLVVGFGGVGGPRPFRETMAAAIAAVLAEARKFDVPLLCLGTTACGQPRHPLYLKRSAALVPWQPLHARSP